MPAAKFPDLAGETTSLIGLSDSQISPM